MIALVGIGVAASAIAGFIGWNSFAQTSSTDTSEKNDVADTIGAQPATGNPFTLNAEPSSVVIPQFHSTGTKFSGGFYTPDVEITLTSLNGFSGNVSLSIVGKPEPLYTILKDKAVTLAPDGEAKTSIRISDADGLTPIGKYKLTIKAISSNGNLTVEQPIDVEIVSPDITGMQH